MVITNRMLKKIFRKIGFGASEIILYSLYILLFYIQYADKSRWSRQIFREKRAWRTLWITQYDQVLDQITNAAFRVFVLLKFVDGFRLSRQ